MSGDSRPRILPPAVLDAIPGAAAQLGPAGEILGVNARWRTLAGEGHLLASTNVTLTANYVDACADAAAAGVPAARDALGALRAVLANESRTKSVEYTIGGSAASRSSRSFVAVITRLAGDGYDAAIVTHTEITSRAANRGGAAGRLQHELNNLLTVVVGYAELLRDNRELPASCRTAVDEILDAARRASALTSPPQG